MIIAEVVCHKQHCSFSSLSVYFQLWSWDNVKGLGIVEFMV